MDESTRQRLSVLLYDVIGQQGYSSKRVRKRSKLMKETFQDIMEHHINTCFNMFEIDFHIDLIIAGSTGEGVAKPLTSDYDVIFSPSRIICVDQRSDVDGMYVMQNEFSNTEPGYVRLVADVDYEDDEGWYGRLTQILCKRCDYTLNNYLSSSLCARFIAEMFTSGNFPQQCVDVTHTQMNGPALTRSAVISFPLLSYKEKIDVDLVVGLQFYSDEIMSRWLHRQRHHQWPSTHIQREIAGMEGYLVPVGHKLSEFQDIEWRISYTTAEQKLVKNMQDEQIRLYAAMKMIHKDFLKPNCENFTSYFVKNIIFWVLEFTPIWAFTPSQFLDRVISTLCHLKRFLKRYFLPNYIIPERNMFLGRMTQVECKKMAVEVQNLIDSGCTFLFTSQKLSLSLQLVFYYPDRAKAYAAWLMQLEDLVAKMTAYNLKLFVVSLESIVRGTAALDLIWACLQSGEHWLLLLELFQLLYGDTKTILDLLLPGEFDKFCTQLRCVLS